MRGPWDEFLSELRSIRERMDGFPSIREATVTSVAPLTVQFDTDTTGTVVHGSLSAGLVVGYRVLTLRLARYVWVLGAKGGSPRQASGRITITPSGSGVATSASVTFPASLFSVTPDVLASVSSPNATVGVSSITSSGCTLTIIRNSTTNTVVTWHALIT